MTQKLFFEARPARRVLQNTARERTTARRTGTHGEDMTIRQATITPAIAAKLLKRNEKNRNINKNAVDQYARDMEAGRWMFNGEALKIATDGRVLDGQHRLLACVQSGQPFVTVVVTGIEDRAQFTMDQGHKRTASDHFKLQGLKNASIIAAAARVLWVWHRGSTLGGRGHVRPSFADLEGERLLWPELVEAADIGHRVAAATRIGLTGSMLAAAGAIMLRIDAPAARDFFEKLRTGAGLSVHDPILILRRTCISFLGSGRTLHAADKIRWVLTSFDDTRNGRSRRMLKRAGGLRQVPGLTIDGYGGAP